MVTLVNETRGNIVENQHPGRIAVVNDEGRLIAHVGDSEAYTFYRSSSKPFQALPVLIRGLAEEKGFTDGEIVFMCSSHTGEDVHLAAALDMLQKCGFSEEDYIMNPTYPSDEATRTRMIRENLPPRRALHNCSGKHIGAMLLAEALTGDHKDYWRPDCAAQKEIARAIAHMSGIAPEAVQTGFDGCGITVFAVPLQGIARGYMKLACPDRIGDAALRAAAEKLVPLIHQNSRMIRGSGCLCKFLNDDPNIVAKGGAEGVYGFALKKERIGFAIKLEDGTEAAWPVVIEKLLRTFGGASQETMEMLARLSGATRLNDCGREIGTRKAVFELIYD